MGGGQTLNVGLAHLDLFGSLGVFSIAPGADFETKFKGLLDDPKGTNAKLATFWIACGDHDTTVQFPRVKTFHELLDKKGIRHTFRVMENGAHTWPVWRVCLSEFLPLLFRQS
jgi:enterochelin esterase-like enzyme